MADVRMTLEEALNLIPVGYFQYKVFVCSGLILMIKAMEMNLQTFLAVCAGERFNSSDSELALLSGISCIGMMFGSFFFGYLADRVGRRLACNISTAIVATCSIASAAANSYVLLLFLRAMCGFGIWL